MSLATFPICLFPWAGISLRPDSAIVRKLTEDYGIQSKEPSQRERIHKWTKEYRDNSLAYRVLSHI